ncbi:12185_t:CDS:1, partial [Ambispora leptoticha]
MNYGTFDQAKKQTVIVLNEPEDDDSINIIAEQIPYTKTPKSRSSHESRYNIFRNTINEVIWTI